jgi:cytochrome c peroxidase
MLVRDVTVRLGLAALLASASSYCIAQNAPPDNSAAALQGEVAHAQQMLQMFPDTSGSSQNTPAAIPQTEIDSDPSGQIASFQPNGATQTSQNAFFQNLGTNGRTCFTCHQGEDGWGLSAQHAQQRFAADPNDPLFRVFDGATCPSDDVSTPAAQQAAYQLLLQKGLIRIGLPMPSNGLQFQITSVADPYNCNTNSVTGLTSATTGIVSIYRRPLPSTNLAFDSTIMWDGREPDLFSQAVDATLTHAQAAAAPTADQLQQAVTFEGCTTAKTPQQCANTPAGAGIFSAQFLDNLTGPTVALTGAGANGGPVAVAQNVANFFIGINDPFGNNPTGAAFSPAIFSVFDSFGNQTGGGPVSDRQQQIARGQQVFNSTPINITGVAGINDALNQPSVSGTCGTCHDTPNVGDHSVVAPLDIGVADAGDKAPPALDISGLPVFTIECTSGPLAGQVFQVTDPGRALISGQCADIGKVKGPILRGLAARAPYFHNGSAATLMDVVNFYDQRFGIGFTDQQKSDLVAFLSSL